MKNLNTEDLPDVNKLIVDIALSFVAKFRLIKIWQYAPRTIHDQKIYVDVGRDTIDIYFNRFKAYKSFSTRSLIEIWNNSTVHEIEDDILYIVALYKSCLEVFNREYALVQLQNILTFVKDLDTEMKLSAEISCTLENGETVDKEILYKLESTQIS